jgi:hypothetical protein
MSDTPADDVFSRLLNSDNEVPQLRDLLRDPDFQKNFPALHAALLEDDSVSYRPSSGSKPQVYSGLNHLPPATIAADTQVTEKASVSNSLPARQVLIAKSLNSDLPDSVA